MSNGSIYGGVTAGQVQGRATGALFFIGFGTVWLLLGLSATHVAGGVGQALGLMVGVVLLLPALDLLRRAKALPVGVIDPGAEVRARLMFRAVNIIQWVSVATAISILSILHMPEYAVTAIAVIVGLHLFPLAASFRNRQHYVTGGLLVAWPLGCLAVLPRTEVSGITALGAGVVLLGSAAVTLARNLWVWRTGDGGMGAVADQKLGG